MNTIVIGPGTKVTLFFSLILEDGTVIDSNFDQAPAVFDVGDDSLLPGYEQVLFGLKSGDENSFQMTPEQGFGQYNEANTQRMKLSDFDPSLKLEKGLVVSFADANRAELPGVIIGIEGDEVKVDFNHPLAGHTVIFRVSIQKVEATITH